MRLTVLILLLSCPLAKASTGVRVLLGIGDQAATRWDGSATCNGAQIQLVEIWRLGAGDAVTGASWRESTRPIQMPPLNGNGPLGANGVILKLSDAPDAEVAIQTTQGNFTFRLRDIPYGKSIKLLNGRVMVDRVPPAAQLTNTPEEEDYPAAATDKDGNIWVAYASFKHNPDHNALRTSPDPGITDFSRYKAPTGGDQILLRKLSGGDPIAITSPGGDVYRPAIAVDSQGKVWVFWSQNDRGNFDLWARSVAAGVAGAPIRITREPGSDVFAVATTDSTGKAWVAWQGWRNGKAAIFAGRQNGNGFTPAMTVASTSGNEWNPAIAADTAGRVTVAWDSYRNGNYDVFMRTAVNGAWGAESPVAATARYEAYPSIAYDPSGRLWVAYEEGSEGWGKDFGAYLTTGAALYQGRFVRLIGFDKEGGAVTTAADLSMALPGTPSTAAESPDVQSNSSGAWLRPDANLPKSRRPNGSEGEMGVAVAPKNTLPRLQVDSSGRLWLAVRSAHPIWHNPVGTVWTEWVSSYDGSAWTGPIFLNHSDNLLDNRPALVSTSGGELTVIGAADGRRGPPGPATMGSGPQPALIDPLKNDLWVNSIVLGPAKSAPAVTATAKPAPSVETPSREETAAIVLMRGYRTSGKLQIVRGEFHRHSEVSHDGNSDGTLIDQWRYALDTAALEWIGCCDHDNGNAREYTWWTTQKLTDIFYTPGKFVPVFNYERSVQYPEGHRNVIFAQRGIRILPRQPRTGDAPVHAPDTQMLYRYLKFFNGVAASHTSGTNMGTDWRDNDPLSEPAVEIYQGDRQSYEMPEAPRTNSEKDSIGGWRPKGFIDQALNKGYKLSFEASSDHISTHISYANIFVTGMNREAVLDGFKKRHVYAATDDILADVTSGNHMMGDEFSTTSTPSLKVKFTGTAPFAKVYIVKDGKYVYTSEPKTATVDFTWKDMAATSGKMNYYYVRGEQENGEIVWASPMWITYTEK